VYQFVALRDAEVVRGFEFCPAAALWQKLATVRIDQSDHQALPYWLLYILLAKLLADQGVCNNRG
jgi:hypothetical protein